MWISANGAVSMAPDNRKACLRGFDKLSRNVSRGGARGYFLEGQRFRGGGGLCACGEFFGFGNGVRMLPDILRPKLSWSSENEAVKQI